MSEARKAADLLHALALSQAADLVRGTFEIRDPPDDLHLSRRARRWLAEERERVHERLCVAAVRAREDADGVLR